MKNLLLSFLLFPFLLSAQTKQEVEDRIKKVENSLAPSVIFNQTPPKYNLEKRMKETGVKGLSIAVIKNYKIEWAKAYGWANEAENIRATTTTRFQSASISKSLNSLGVLKLVEKGKINPNADINDYLKSWKFPYDSLSKGKKINIFHLLSHSAGLSIHGFPGYQRSKTLPTVPQILDGTAPANTRAVRSLYEPGKQFKYSGGGTTISQLIVTDITGKKYEDYMWEEVLKPLGMTNSSYQQPPSDTSNLSTGYYGNGKTVWQKFHVYPEQAAAGLWTTPTDLARYIIECQLAYEGKSSKVLSSSMMKTRMTPYVDQVAALGVFIENRGGRKYFNHNGGNEAFLSTSFGSLEGGDGVVIMINGDNFKVIEELTNSVAQVYGWKDFYTPKTRPVVSVAADSLKLYVGSYKLPNDTITISFCGKDLCARQSSAPGKEFKLLFIDNTTFMIEEAPDLSVKVQLNEGKAEALLLREGRNTIRATRIE